MKICGFGEAALDLDGQHDLLHLAAEVAIGREEQIARQLHGQRRCALGAALQHHVAPGGTEDAPHVDAPVAFEIFVLGGDQGVAQDFGEIAVAVDDAALQSELADDAVLVVIELGDGGRAVVLEFGHLRQVGGIDEDHAGGRAGDGGKDDEQSKEGIADELQSDAARGRSIGGNGRVFDNALHVGLGKG